MLIPEVIGADARRAGEETVRKRRGTKNSSAAAAGINGPVVLGPGPA